MSSETSTGKTTKRSSRRPPKNRSAAWPPTSPPSPIPKFCRPWDAEFTQALAAPELCVVVLECWDDDTVTGDDFLGTVAVPLSEVTPGKQLDLPLLAATLAPWPRKHGAPSLQVTFDLVYADARGPSGGLA